jgi:hypothetical protein
MRVASSFGASRLVALDSAQFWHADDHQHQVGTGLYGRRGGRRAVARLGDDFKLWIGAEDEAKAMFFLK